MFLVTSVEDVRLSRLKRDIERSPWGERNSFSSSMYRSSHCVIGTASKRQRKLLRIHRDEELVVVNSLFRTISPVHLKVELRKRGRKPDFCDEAERRVRQFVFGNVTRRRETCPGIEVGFNRPTWLGIVSLAFSEHLDVAELTEPANYHLRRADLSLKTRSQGSHCAWAYITS